MMPIIEDKLLAHFQYFNLPNLKNLLVLIDTRKKVQQTARRCANEFWVELDIQFAANTGNIRGMHDGIKKSVGPVQRKTFSLKSYSGVILTEKNKQMTDGWGISQICTLFRTPCL